MLYIVYIMNYTIFKEIREIKGISLLALSKDTNINRNTLSRIERGIANPSISTIEIICSKLDLEIRLLIKQI